MVFNYVSVEKLLHSVKNALPCKIVKPFVSFVLFIINAAKDSNWLFKLRWEYDGSAILSSHVVIFGHSVFDNLTNRAEQPGIQFSYNIYNLNCPQVVQRLLHGLHGLLLAS